MKKAAHRMGRAKNGKEVVVSKKIAFKTKDGKEVSFAPKGKNAAKKKVHMKSLEKRLTAMEKAILHYNHAVEAHKERKKGAGDKPEVGKSDVKVDKPAKGKKAGSSAIVVGKGQV